MKYMLLIYGNEEAFASVGEEAFAEIVDHPPGLKAGSLTLDDRPGIGASLLDDAPSRRPAIAITATR